MTESPHLDRPAPLDGGMGSELRSRRVEIMTTNQSAGALMTAPTVIRDIHRDYVDAGAVVITMNTYGVIRYELASERSRSVSPNRPRFACQLAVEAHDQAGRPVAIAGSLPPLTWSY